MIKCKDSVRFKVLRPEIYGIFAMLTVIFARYKVDCVITRGTEIDDGGPHPNGYAIDLRSHDLKHGDALAMRDELRKSLGERYFVDLESVDEPEEHFHIQIRKQIWREEIKNADSAFR